MMKMDFLKYCLIALLSVAASLSVSAQNSNETGHYDYVDTVIYKAPPVVDTTLVGSDIFDLLPLNKVKRFF